MYYWQNNTFENNSIDEYKKCNYNTSLINDYSILYLVVASKKNTTQFFSFLLKKHFVFHLARVRLNLIKNLKHFIKS